MFAHKNNPLSRPLQPGLWALLLVWLTGCAQLGTLSDSLFMMTPQQESELGAKVAKQVEEEYKLVQDPDIVNYVNRVGQKVWANAPKGEITPHFYVVDNEEINAFAIPGGNVYVHTGLLNAADDEAELAGVISHELGHVIRRHGARQVSRATGVQMLEQILVGNEGGQAAQMVSGLISQGVMFNYSRDMEREADTIAVGTLYRAKYDPSGMTTFFGKLIKAYGSGGSDPISKFFASHPPTQERIDNVNRILATLPNPSDSRPITDLRRVQGRMKELNLK